MKNLLQAFREFFTAPQPLIKSSVFRVLVGLTLTVFYFERFLDFEWLFSERGLVPYSLAATMVPEFYKPPLLLFSSHEGFLYSLHIAFIVALLLLTLGLGGRILAWVTFILHVIFMQRNYVVIYGPDFIATVWLLYMGLLKTDRYLTIKQFLYKQPMLPISWTTCEMGDAFNTVGVRLIQIQLCVIYAYGGTEKLRGITWWRGDAIWNTLANGQLVTSDYSFIAHMPWLVAGMTFATLLWEIYFPVIVWVRKLRPWVLAFGIVLHVGIGWTMNIVFFSLLMMCSYVMFLERWQPFFRRASR